MNDCTLEALQLSIKHWEENVAAKSITDIDISVGTCALCTEFYGNNCVGCPVSESTGKICCMGSPYQKVLKPYQNELLVDKPMPPSDELRRLMQAELDFLRSLLPEEMEGTQEPKCRS